MTHKYKIGDFVKLTPKIINQSQWWREYDINPYTDYFEAIDIFSSEGHVFRNVRNNINIRMYDTDMLPYDGKPYDPVLDRIYKTYSKCKTTKHWKPQLLEDTAPTTNDRVWVDELSV